jgi:NitT/TauT family transport system substrate-binding protein
MHRVLDSFAVLGGPHTFNLVWTTARWHDAHPALVAAFIAALDIAMAMIREDPVAAAASYIRQEKARQPVNALAAMIARPENQWTTTPTRMMVFARFMHASGAIAHMPGDWRDLFFPGATALNGG